MKAIHILIFTLIICCYVLAEIDENRSVKFIIDSFLDKSPVELFRVWHYLHSRTYLINSDEGLIRFNNFLKNMGKVNSHNSNRENNFSLGLNEFADHTIEEFREKYLTKSEILFKAIRNINFLTFDYDDSLISSQNKESLLKDISWINYSNASHVYNQGSCGSCWAFAVTQSVELAYSINMNEKVILSKQQLIDCDRESDGCDGGLLHTALNYIRDNGLELEDDYQYEFSRNTCRVEKKNKTYKIKGFDVCLEEECQNDNTLYKTLKQGPVAAVVDASMEFMLYSGGIYDKTCKEMNHAILVIGYDRIDDNSGIWIVKNSWGKHWGDHGYIRIKQDKNYNSCLLNTYFARPYLN